ncbi:recombinase family protein [Clostridium sp. HMP27]|uniref:recombinase family protein n=1 Tax=Clostridium sp. HMP27 TaxID=1487921 RepID=UPI00052CA913|nr:recombinase family protein [Clostridium sp. HMP27]KGK88594.1 hypothetical protein DP68_07025 [Clostridium sp. HMP27]
MESITVCNYVQNKSNIKDVAIYLRKSRGEEGDLAKHRMMLEELCKIKRWRYTEYSEIGTSDSIDLRPKMIELLTDVGNELYDAVVVMDMDRLSRGDGEEQARIKNTLRRSNTLIVTPNKIYDLNDDSDDMYSDFEGLMARVEYKQIKKRLRRGKKQGSRRGDWTNGTPPFPYVYQQWFDENNGKMHYNEKGLVVNKDKYNVYRYMIDKITIDCAPPSQIAWELNKRGILSPRGGIWHGHTIHRILIDETHLGKIISNKTCGDGHKVKRSKDSKGVIKFSKDEWIVVDNCHEAIKTQDEHNKILMFFDRTTKTPKRKGSRTYPLSGLIKCAKCGHTMVVGYRSDKTGAEYIKPCWYIDEAGNKCGNRGSGTDIIHTEIMNQLFLYEQELKQSLFGKNSEDEKILQDMNMTLDDLQNLERKICKIDELVEDDYYTLLEAKERKMKLKTLIDEAERRLNLLKIKLDNSKNVTNQERLNLIEKFKKNIAKEGLSAEEINDWYKSIISHIVWERNDNHIVIDINFL